MATTRSLPKAVGPLTEVLFTTLSEPPPGVALPDAPVEPYGHDLQLALCVCYELHYQGFPGVSSAWEWNPELLGFRARLEDAFLNALRRDVPGGDDVTAEVDALLVDSAGTAGYLCDEGEWWQMREYFVHRSIYHLKEADPHAWVLPRLRGRAKAALVAVEFDEFGGGRAERMHSRLFADLLDGAGLNSGYLAYVNDVPTATLAVVNMMSSFGLHRGLRGALVGHFAAAEITTAPAAKRMEKALQRMEAHPACIQFYTEHVEADAVHEQVLRHDVLGDLMEREPELAADVVLGIQATELLENHLADHLVGCWADSRSSLLHPLPEGGA